MSNEVELIEPEARTAVGDRRAQSTALVETSPAALVRMAVEKDLDLDRLERLIAMKERFDAQLREQSYTAALGSFKSEGITIVKNKTITDGPLKGKKFANLATVVKTITEALSRNGLTATWKQTKDERDWIEVTCYLKHKDGHVESVSMGGPPDSGGAKNALQARMSTVSYLERYTLKAITGLAEDDDDDDGAAAGDKAVAVVSEKILDGLTEKLEKVTTDADALALWRVGRDSLEATSNIEALNEFRALVEAKRTALKAGGTSK